MKNNIKITLKDFLNENITNDVVNIDIDPIEFIKDSILDYDLGVDNLEIISVDDAIKAVELSKIKTKNEIKNKLDKFFSYLENTYENDVILKKNIKYINTDLENE